MNKVVIYGIVDPISNQLRYIGHLLKEKVLILELL